MSNIYLPWGQLSAEPQEPLLYSRNNTQQLLSQINEGSLPYGNGRSYGDSCLSATNQPLIMSDHNYFIAFDKEQGVIHCESGVLLKDIIRAVIGSGWFLPVTPGTQYVTIAGAVANDVHGKNHHVAGTFGCHIIDFNLLRTDGQIFNCSAKNNPDLYAATIGGLGLTGIITDVRLQLKAIDSPNINCESIKFDSVDDYFDLVTDSDENYEYTVSWIDCLAKGSALGRGMYFRGNHQQGKLPNAIMPSKMQLSCPITPPISLINKLSLKLFNTVYYNKQLSSNVSDCQGYQPFFYPLDAIHSWNRIYGKKGFQQLQFVIPKLDAKDKVKAILQDISAAGIGSFLAVLKDFGDIKSPGLLSFPMQGTTLALDFPNGVVTDKLIQRAHDSVAEVGGRVYPAKDAAMSASNFRKFYANWEQLEDKRDPNLCSKFWQRTALG